MHTHDHSSDWLQDPGGDDTLRIFEDILLQENEQQEAIHRLTHQGMDEALVGHIEEAEDLFSQALVLAQEHRYPRWEAQVFYYAAGVFDRRGMPKLALQYAEQALTLFHEHGPLRMEASVGTLLAGLLYKTGQPQSAPPLIKRVVDLLMNGVETKQISVPEGHYGLFSAYHQMGHICRALRLLPQSEDSFEEALELARDLQSDQDAHTIITDLIDLYLEIGDLDRAVELGEDALRETDGFEPHNLAFLTSVNFDLGLVYLRTEEWEASIDRSRAAYAYFKRDRASTHPSPLRPAEWDTAFVGKLSVNLGSAYNGLGCAAQREDFYSASIAYWRMGEELLTEAHAEDVEVPRRNLRLVRQAYPDPAIYDLLLRLSEPLLQSLHTEMAGELVAERDGSIRLGRQALVRKQYDVAAAHFLAAMQRDPLDLCLGRHWHTFARLWDCHTHRDLLEIAECFELDSQGARDEAMASLLFAEWCKMGQNPSASAYLAATQETFALGLGEDPIDRLEGLARRHVNRHETLIYAAMMLYLRGKNEECLTILESHDLDTPRLIWCRAFWQAVAYANSGQGELASRLIGEALSLGMPPVLLGPLKWLKACDAEPTSFFMLEVHPLFVKYRLPFADYLESNRDRPLSLPSQARTIATIRPGVRMAAPEMGEAEYEDVLLIDLPGARGPGEKATLIFVEFDAVEDAIEEVLLLWPTTFAVRYPGVQGEIANRWQEYQIDYIPGKRQITLTDRGFQRLTLPLESVGRDHERKRSRYVGRGGHYWVAPDAGVSVEDLGTTTRYKHLPRGMLSYVQELVNEALPHLEIFCDDCNQTTQRTDNVWCRHIWFCKRCTHVSSPTERSRKLMGQMPHYCPHRFPIVEM
jgi:tetratricopeptide (TPR) repeat protein